MSNTQDEFASDWDEAKEIPPDSESTIPASALFDNLGNPLDLEDGDIPPDTPITVVLADGRNTTEPYGVKSNKAEWAPDCPPEEMERRIEFVRDLLIQDYSDCQIKKICSELWSKKIVMQGDQRIEITQRKSNGKILYNRRYVERYITWARNRNGQLIAGTADEKLATSISYWARKKQDAEQIIAREKRAIESARKIYNDSIAEISRIEDEAKRVEGKFPKNVNERLEILEMRCSNATREMERAHESQRIANLGSMNAQEKLDRLNGVHAPIKIARTDSTGKDIPKMTDEEVTERLRELISKIPTKLPTRVVEAESRPVGIGAVNTEAVLPAPQIIDPMDEFDPMNPLSRHAGKIQSPRAPDAQVNIVVDRDSPPAVTGIVTGFSKTNGKNDGKPAK